MIYDIFISYRRKGGYETAKHLYDLLTHDGYNVSFDIDTLRNGDFDTALLKRIEECTDFILILNKGAFDRTLDPDFNPANDWLRNELAYALKLEKNIIPVMLEGFDEFPDNLPADIAKVVRKNGPKYDNYYFDDFYRKMKLQFFETPEPESKLSTSSSKSSSTVKIKSNMTFDFYIDGEYKERVEENTLYQIVLNDGEYYLEFVSPYDGNIDKVYKTIQLTGSDIILEIDLQSVADARKEEEKLAIEKIRHRYGTQIYYEFFCGLCAVRVNGLYGFVNSKLEEVIPCIYEDKWPFEAFSLQASVKQYGKWGMIDQKGKVCIPLEYDAICGVDSSVAEAGDGNYVRALKNNRCGIVDLSGNIVIPFEYDAISPICNDLVILRSGNKVGLINLHSGETLLPIEFEAIKAGKEYAIFYKNGLCGIKSFDGSVAIEPKYECIKPFAEGLAAVRQNGLWGFLDTNGHIRIPAKYKDCSSFCSGMAAISLNGKWGFIDHSGKLTIPIEYESVSPMLGGTSIVRSEYGTGLINRLGNILIKPAPSAIIQHCLSAFSEPDKAFPVSVKFPAIGKHFIVDKYGKIHNPNIIEDLECYKIFTILLEGEQYAYADNDYTAFEPEQIITYDPEDGLYKSDFLAADEPSIGNGTQSDIYRIKQIISSRTGTEISELEDSTHLRNDLDLDDDDYTDLMMAIEEEFGVFADETYFNSISTIEKLAEYVLRLESEEYEDNDPEPEPKPEPKKDTPKGPRLKRGDTYYLDGTCGIVLEFNDATGEGKLVSKDRITNTWEDPSFSGIWKKLQSKAPFTSSKDGRINCNMIKATKEWDEKYPCVWWCSQLGQEWYLPSVHEFDELFFSPEVQQHYNAGNNKDTISYWTSNTKFEDHNSAWIVTGPGKNNTSDRKNRHFLVAMRYFKI